MPFGFGLAPGSSSSTAPTAEISAFQSASLTAAAAASSASLRRCPLFLAAAGDGGAFRLRRSAVSRGLVYLVTPVCFGPSASVDGSWVVPEW